MNSSPENPVITVAVAAAKTRIEKDKVSSAGLNLMHNIYTALSKGQQVTPTEVDALLKGARGINFPELPEDLQNEALLSLLKS